MPPEKVLQPALRQVAVFTARCEAEASASTSGAATCRCDDAHSLPDAVGELCDRISAFKGDNRVA